MSEHGSFLDLNLDAVPEMSTVPGGREYKLKISSVDTQESKGDKTAGQSMLKVRFTILDHSDTAPLYEYIMLPSDQADEDTNNMRKRQLKNLIQALGWDLSQGFNIDELVGEECWAILDEEESPQYGKQNRVKRYVAEQTA